MKERPILFSAPGEVMKGQKKSHSFLESLVNVAIGYFVALASQLIVFPMFGIHIPLSSNICIGLWFTGISIVRSFILRRIFNTWMVKSK